MSDLTEFLLARIAEDERPARSALGAKALVMRDSADGPKSWIESADRERLFEFDGTRFTYAATSTIALADHITHWLPARVLAECEAKRRIVEFHEAWPVLVETEPRFERTGDDLTTASFRMSQEIAWLTTREYVARFGTEPPTTPILRALAAVYADHPDYREEWRP